MVSLNHSLYADLIRVRCIANKQVPFLFSVQFLLQQAAAVLQH